MKKVEFIDVIYFLYQWMTEQEPENQVKLYRIVRDLYRMRYGEDIPDFEGKQILDEYIQRME